MGKIIENFGLFPGNVSVFGRKKKNTGKTLILYLKQLLSFKYYNDKENEAG